MKDIYPKIEELFEMNRFSVMATIIGQSGSAPRSIGTKFLILEDGSSIGTIGGGPLEMSVIEESRKVFASRLPLRYSHLSDEPDVADPDMSCGGDIEVFLEPVYPDNLSHLRIFKEVMDVLRRGGSGILATVVDPDQWYPGQIPKMFLKSSGERIGSLMGIREIEDAIMERIDQILSERQPSTIICRDKECNQSYVFVEPLVSNPILYIFGGGHVSSKIVPLANRVGFMVVVIDDRAEFSDPVNFPEAEEVYRYPFDGVMDRLNVDESSFLVICTRGHSHDKTVLAQALKTAAQYIGMIGSKRKISIIYKKLMEEGFTQEELDRVHSPIGIDIGAETPEEIAVSIVAELIKARVGV